MSGTPTDARFLIRVFISSPVSYPRSDCRAPCAHPASRGIVSGFSLRGFHASSGSKPLFDLGQRFRGELPSPLSDPGRPLHPIRARLAPTVWHPGVQWTPRVLAVAPAVAVSPRAVVALRVDGFARRWPAGPRRSILALLTRVFGVSRVLAGRFGWRAAFPLRWAA